jgi:predicted transcriptional regulator
MYSEATADLRRAMPESTITTVRLKPDVRKRLDEMAEYADRSMATVIAAAVNVMYAQYAEERRSSEALAAEGYALLERLEQRLGERFFKGCGEAAFERMPNGQVSLRIRGEGYFEGAGGRLFKARDRDGRAEFAEIAEDGTVGDWIVALEPQLN